MLGKPTGRALIYLSVAATDVGAVDGDVGRFEAAERRWLLAKGAGAVDVTEVYVSGGITRK